MSNAYSKENKKEKTEREKLIDDKDYQEVRDTGSLIIEKITLDKRFLVIHAQVKVGKRLIAQYVTLKLEKHNDFICEHIFLSALHRKADEDQRNKLAEYDMDVFSINKKTKLDEINKVINEKLGNDNYRIIIHLDELDYGSGKKQLLQTIYNNYIGNKRIHFVTYSATPYEAQLKYLDMSHISIKPEIIKHIPNKNYLGIKYYIDNNQFFDSRKFKLFDICYDINNYVNHKVHPTKNLTNMIKELHENSQYNKHCNDPDNKKPCFGFLRLNNKKIPIKGKHKKQISDFNVFMMNQNNIKKYYKDKYGIEILLKFTGDDKRAGIELVNWSSEDYWKGLNRDIPTIFIVQETVSRSTELKCHHLFAWAYENRKNSAISTIVQSQERWVGYLNGLKPSLKIYGNLYVAKYSAGLIDLETVLKSKTVKNISTHLNVKILTNHLELDYKTFNYNNIEDAKKYYSEKSWNLTSSKQDHEAYIKMQNGTFKKMIENRKKNKDKHGFILDKIRKKTEFKKWKVSELKKERGGISKNKTKIRVNIGYEDNISDPKKFTIVIKSFKEVSKKLKPTNNSMYQNQTKHTNNIETPKIYTKKVRSRKEQEKFRKYLLDKYESKCKICSQFQLPDAVQAAHIIPYCYLNETERLDFNNGIILCCNCHSYFDSGYIGIKDDNIMIHPELLNNNNSYSSINNKKINLSELNKYFDFHYKHIFKDN